MKLLKPFVSKNVLLRNYIPYVNLSLFSRAIDFWMQVREKARTYSYYAERIQQIIFGKKRDYLSPEIF